MAPPSDVRRMWGVFLAALAVLTLIGIDYRDDPFFSTPVSDAAVYDAWARRLAADGLAGEPGFHQSPLFPLLLGAVYRAVPESSAATAALALQSVLLAAALAWLVPLGRALFQRRLAGLAAAGAGLLYAPLAFHALKTLPVALALATQALAVVLLLATRERGRPLRGAAAGIAFGLACLARAEFLLFLPVALILLRGPRDRRSARIAFVAGVALAIAPVTAHNLRRGDTTLIASSAGENLFIGNRRGGDGGHHALDPRAGDLPSQRVLARTLAEEARGTPLTGNEVSAYWMGRAWREVAAAPGEWLRLQGRKLARWITPGDPTDLYSLTLERSAYVPTLHALPLPTLGLWVLAAAGAFSLRPPRLRGAWPLLALLGIHAAVLMTFFVSTRLRIPFLFWLCPLAGMGVAVAVERWRGGARRFAGILIALVGGALLADLALRQPPPREVLRLAALLSSQERLEESLVTLEPLLRRPDPGPAVLDQAGWVCSKQGALEQALSYYARALEAGPDARREQQTRSRMADVLERLGRFEEAAEAHRRSISVDPATAGAWFERAGFRLRRGDRAGAIDDLEEARRLSPGWPAPGELLRHLREEGGGG